MMQGSSPSEAPTAEGVASSARSASMPAAADTDASPLAMQPAGDTHSLLSPFQSPTINNEVNHIISNTLHLHDSHPEAITSPSTDRHDMPCNPAGEQLPDIHCFITTLGNKTSNLKKHNSSTDPSQGPTDTNKACDSAMASIGSDANLHQQIAATLEAAEVLEAFDAIYSQGSAEAAVPAASAAGRGMLPFLGLGSKARRASTNKQAGAGAASASNNGLEPCAGAPFDPSNKRRFFGRLFKPKQHARTADTAAVSPSVDGSSSSSITTAVIVLSPPSNAAASNGPTRKGFKLPGVFKRGGTVTTASSTDAQAALVAADPSTIKGDTGPLNVAAATMVTQEAVPAPVCLAGTDPATTTALTGSPSTADATEGRSPMIESGQQGKSSVGTTRGKALKLSTLFQRKRAAGRAATAVAAAAAAAVTEGAAVEALGMVQSSTTGVSCTKPGCAPCVTGSVPWQLSSKSAPKQLTVRVKGFLRSSRVVLQPNDL